MNDREGAFARTVRPDDRIRPLMFRRTLDPDLRPIPQTSPQLANPRIPRKLVVKTPISQEKIKQWELVKGEKGLTVVEKRPVRNVLARSSSATNPSSSADFYRSPVPIRNSNNQPPWAEVMTRRDQDLGDRKIYFPIRNDASVKNSGPVSLPVSSNKYDPGGISGPVRLDMVLNQSQTRNNDSNDALQQLEQQVRSIEVNTISAKKAQIREQLPQDEYQRYAEHEDLLINVDDETEG